MRRRDVVLASVTAVLVPRVVRAQKKTAVIGLLWNDSTKPSPYASVLLDALRQRGYAVPGDLRVEDRVGLEGYASYGEGIADLVRAKVDVIVTNGTTALQAAAKATKDIPIVAITGSDPVKLGFAASLSRPGGNITGLAVSTVGLGAKRMELLKELTPGLSRVGVLLAPNVANPTNRREAETAGAALNMQVHFAEVRAIDEIESRVGELRQARVEAIAVTAATLMSSHSARVIAAIATHRLPAVYPNERYAEAGGLMTYSSSVSRAFVSAAGYVDRILKGANPGQLPIEQFRDVDLVINLRAAKTLGLKVPQTLLVRADRVIE
jgi:putative ABC transport system substrate-binding protein